MEWSHDACTSNMPWNECFIFAAWSWLFCPFKVALLQCFWGKYLLKWHQCKRCVHPVEQEPYLWPHMEHYSQLEVSSSHWRLSTMNTFTTITPSWRLFVTQHYRDPEEKASLVTHAALEQHKFKVPHVNKFKKLYVWGTIWQLTVAPIGHFLWSLVR